MKSIYCLRDPRTSEVRYVGASNLQVLYRRLHTEQLREWFSELDRENLREKFEILEADVEDWSAAERKWCQHFKKLGHQLLNSMLLASRPTIVKDTSKAWTPEMKERLRQRRALQPKQDWTPEMRKHQAEMTKKSWEERRKACKKR